jgi:hypothetical protein
MAGGKGNYLSNQMLDTVLGAVAYTAPATVYIALYTVAPTGAGGGTEVSGGSYARVAVTNNLTNFPSASAQSKSNGVLWNFGTATANWNTIVAAAVYDASTGGNELYWGPLATPRTVLSGDSFNIPIGGAVFTES